MEPATAATAFRLSFDDGIRDPVAWIESLLDGDGDDGATPPPSLFPPWPPPAGTVVIVAIDRAAGGFAAYLVLTRARLDEFAAVEAGCRKLFFVVAARRLVAEIPALAAALARRHGGRGPEG